jgi:hypothetical protein
MMRWEILNPLISRTPKIGREISDKKQLSEIDFFRKMQFCKLLHAQNIRKTTKKTLEVDFFDLI